MPPPLDPVPRGKLARGITMFVVLTVAGLVALWHFTGGGDLRALSSGASVGFLLLAACSAVGDLLIGAIRYQIFLRRIRPETSLWLPIRADLANRFVGAVTPSQTGGGPAQVFVLWRGGIPIPDALSFLLVNFLSTLVFFLTAGGAAAWLFRERFPEGVIHALVQYGFAAFTASLVVMLLALLRPHWVVRPVVRCAARLGERSGPAARLARRASSGLADTVERYRSACTRFVRDNPVLPLQSFLLTLLLYANKFSLAWLVMRGLGVEGDYLTTLAVQALLHFILFVAPTPGASGIAEVGTGALMAILMPQHLLAPFTLVYRFLLLYLPAAVGALVLLREVRPARARPAAEARSAVDAALVVCALLLPGAGNASAQTSSVSGASVTRVPVPEGAAASAVADDSSAADVRIESLVVAGLRAVDEDSACALFQASVDLARAWVRERPADADAHYLLSVALGYRLEHVGLRTKLGMAMEVRAEAERALALDPSHPGAHHVLGRLHAGAMRLNGVARLVLREVLGAAVLEGASWERAEHHFQQAWQSDPASPRHPMELGALYLDTGRPGAARAVLERATALVPRSAADSMATTRARALLARSGGT